jgi:hypothetical protein
MKEGGLNGGTKQGEIEDAFYVLLDEFFSKLQFEGLSTRGASCSVRSSVK